MLSLVRKTEEAEKIARKYFPDYMPKDGKHTLHSADLVFAVSLGIDLGQSVTEDWLVYPENKPTEAKEYWVIVANMGFPAVASWSRTKESHYQEFGWFIPQHPGSWVSHFMHIKLPRTFR